MVKPSDGNTNTVFFVWNYAQYPRQGRLLLHYFFYAAYKNSSSETPVATGKIINPANHGARSDDEIDHSKAILAALKQAHSEKCPVLIRFAPCRFQT